MFLFIKQNRPEVVVRPAFTDRVLEAAVIVLLIVMWGITVYFWNILPPEIPVHFDLAGQANGYGGKSALFLMAGLGTFVNFLLGIAAYYPKSINMPVVIKYPRQYVLACRMVRVVNLLVALLFISIVVNMAVAGSGFRSVWANCSELGCTALILLATVYYCWLIHRAGLR